jgi:putative membrane protein
MQVYFWTKTAHVVFVMAWMGGVFYLPRILVNLAEAGDGQTVEEQAVRARLVLMGRRLYRFGHIMFGLAFALGLVLVLHFHIEGGWLHAKLALVALMLAYYIVSGRWLKGVERGRALPSSRTLRWFNELPVFLLVAIVYLVLAKSFCFRLCRAVIDPPFSRFSKAWRVKTRPTFYRGRNASGFGNCTGTPLPSQSPASHSTARSAGIACSMKW